jgi:hypothetical protein
VNLSEFRHFDLREFFAGSVPSVKAQKITDEIVREETFRLLPEPWLLERWRAQGALANRFVCE